jgi:hypothetical protein
MITFLDELDVSISKKFHSFDSKITTWILYPFARMFNPQVICLPIVFLSQIA